MIGSGSCILTEKLWKSMLFVFLTMRVCLRRRCPVSGEGIIAFGKSDKGRPSFVVSATSGTAGIISVCPKYGITKKITLRTKAKIPTYAPIAVSLLGRDHFFHCFRDGNITVYH